MLAIPRHKHSSKLAVGGPSGSTATPPGPRTQAELKESLIAEIWDNTWQFPASRLAQILSPKHPKTDDKAVGGMLSLDEYKFEVDDLAVAGVPDKVVRQLGTFQKPSSTTKGEVDYYPNVATYLTRCVEECHKALDNLNFILPRRDRWNRNLEFIVAKPVANHVEGSAALKPDIIGGYGISDLGPEEQFSWDWDPSKPRNSIAIPVEVKSSWRSMVVQAATYAHGLFSTGRPRMFAIVLAFNQTENKLRFLVFHRGGLTASKECNIKTLDGRKQMVQIFLALALWKTPTDAGFIGCCGRDTYSLPDGEDGQSCVSGTGGKVLAQALCVRGRASVVRVLNLRSGSATGPPSPTEPQSPSAAAPSPSQPPEVSPSPAPTSRRRSARIIKQAPSSSKRTSEQAGGDEETRSRGPKRRKTEKGKGREQLPMIPEDSDDESPTNPVPPYGALDYSQPVEIIRSERNTSLSEVDHPIVLKMSWGGIDSARNEAEMYHASEGRFGIIPHLCSYGVMGKYREVISNFLFLPEQDEIRARHWNIFCNDPPERADLRVFHHTILGVEGQPLVEAKSPKQLSRAWAHFVLGWLSIYLSGYLQRDLSIRNIFMTEKPVERKVFEVPKQFLEHLSSMKKEDKGLVDEIETLCKRVGELVAELGISGECTGFVADGDLAVPWKDYFDRREGEKSGTPEFLSRAIIETASLGVKYPHSPVDDLESCFWVALWSTVFNQDNEKTLSAKEIRIRGFMAKGLKTEATNSLQVTGEDQNHIEQDFLPVLEQWWNKVNRKPWLWQKEVTKARNEGEGFYLLRFHRQALEGVVDILEVLSDRWEGGISSEVAWEAL